MVAPCTFLVPLRSPGAGKTRLAPDLDRDARAALAGAMLADVVAALRATDLGPVVIAASGPAAAAAASALRVDVVLDDPGGRGLDDAVEHARRMAAPTGDVLVIQADLPAVTPADVTAVAGADAEVVVAPTPDGGTGALLRRPGSRIGTAFGPDSAGAHQRLAREAGAALAVVERPGYADVDTWTDLDMLRVHTVGASTAAFLRGWLPPDRSRHAG